MAGHVLVGPGHPVARDRAEHDAGVHRQAGLVAHASLVEAPGTHGLDHRVGAPHQLEEHLAPLLGAQVERDRALPPADVQVHQRGALDDGPGHLPDVVARGRLDLHDVGAEVGERGGDGAGPEHRALDDADAPEGGGGRGGGHAGLLRTSAAAGSAMARTMMAHCLTTRQKRDRTSRPPPMDLSFTPDQDALREAAQRLYAKESHGERVREVEADGFDPRAVGVRRGDGPPGHGAARGRSAAPGRR